MSAAPAPADAVPDAPVRAPPAAGAAVERGGAARRPIVGFRSAAQIVVPESVGYVRIGVAARGSLRGPVRLSVTPAGGAARIHEDFVLPATEITLDPDQPAGDVLVAIVSDGIPENVEDFRLQLRLEAGDADIGTDGIDVVVTDDD
jgi:hypothetical protein